MASAATLQLTSANSILGDYGYRQPYALTPTVPTKNTVDGSNATPDDLAEAIRLAALCREAFNLLDARMPDFDHAKSYTADEILSLPMDRIRLPDELFSLPRRKSARSRLAEAVATLLYPATHDNAVSPVIRYDAARVKLRAWVALQRKHDIFAATKRNGHSFRGLTGGAAPGVHAPVWASRILAQGPWDPSKFPVSLAGTKAIPMPVSVADAADLAPFFNHLERGGTHELDEASGSLGTRLDGGKGEPFYGVKGAEFRKGVVYQDGRMDLCKMVVGPDHIGSLMDSLRPNPFVRHFLLGNNIIGPVGAQEIARFIREFPERMDTWYLAGNCIDATSFRVLVDALVDSDAVTNVWLKRNPLGPVAAADVFRLITETKNLRTLDLDQTELGDAGIAELFQRLTSFSSAVVPGRKKLPLRNIYLNGNGISTKAASAIAAFLSSPACGIASLYLSCNPLGDEGAQVLASGIRQATQLQRLSLQSAGLTTEGAIDIFRAVTSHPGMRMLDVGQAYATLDLGQAWNYIRNASAPVLCELLSTNQTLEYLNLGHCPITPPELRRIDAAVLNSSLLYYSADSILPEPHRKEPTFNPSADATMPELHSISAPTKGDKALEKAVDAHLEANVKARFGTDMTYTRFIDEELRWMTSDKNDVRKIDSVYRNRDAGFARRKQQLLVKDWDSNDDTLDRVMNAKGPFCAARKH
ncbi:leucine rich repeat protein [Colletotrichum scovillei]|uniref:Leucine rich repeat protein n=1 Tax=Colletotrichum scovillei TaxID=1209932 RepID=A0A9P7QW73_9PEZI|nr:leucine rich repeat protein [Colletotrichum scovillei]KAF4775365.1 leucine rich repeat protein [Colletotrichum scovillei]KAG7042582.1 leucine rich repeat protein [Colletotrichum scovillei]KAG7043171.1 leucine rich repeat protein [Colletotrichum scovillei]KAG7062619.1 leucine rich repeat protein [Colletotrichum scovillei]